jgi:two-component system, cell cycle sensor histidine kinase and response regulator CckA
MARSHVRRFVSRSFQNDGSTCHQASFASPMNPDKSLEQLLRSLQAGIPGCRLAVRTPGEQPRFVSLSDDLEPVQLERALQAGEREIFVSGGRVRLWPWSQRSLPGCLFCFEESGATPPAEILHSFCSVLALFWEREELRRRQSWKMESLRSLLDHSLELITVLDPDGNVYYQTPSFRRLLGLDGASAAQLNYLDWVHPEDLPLVRDCLLRVTAGAETVGPMEYRLVQPAPEESQQFLESWFTQLPTGGDGAAVVVHSRDISMRKAAARALISRERRYRQVLDELHQAVFELDHSGTLLFVNSSWERITGRNSNQSLGKPLLEFFDVGPNPPVPLHREVFCRNGPSGPWWVELWLHPHRNGRGVLGLALDITERKLMQRQLDKMAQLVDQAVEIVVLLDSYGRVTYVNPAFTRHTGAAPETLMWRPFFEAFQDDEQSDGSEILARIGTDRFWSGRMRLASGELTVEAVISRVHDEGGEFREYLVTCRDVTRETLLEEQLRVSQRLESLGLLAGGIAHDFNNLLQVIMANVALEQLGRAEENLAASDHLQDVVEAAQRAQRMTRQLLTFASQQPIRSERVELDELVSGTLRIVGRWFPPGVRYVYHGSPEAWVECDASQLEQVVLNLAVNARDAMPEGGELTVSLLQEDGFCKLSFTDTGVGMSAAQRARIFEPFFTTKSNEGGTGLGLSVVYGIVRRHRGRIEVRSAPGEGTTFEVYLPLATAAAAAEPLPQTVPPPRRATILVADDEALIRSLHAKVLEKHGFRVLLAKDAGEALELFGHEPDQIDGLLLDVSMPDIDGIELFRRIRRRRSDIPVLFCSAYARKGILPEHEDVEVDYLSKPFDAQELVAKLRRLLSA